MPIIALARATTEEVQALAEGMEWVELPAQTDELSWRPQAMDASIAWRMLDESFGEFSFEGKHADLARADLGVVFDLLDDVDVMTEIGNATTPGELEAWARRLGAFAEGGDVYEVTLDVFKGLLASERREFVVAAIQGLRRARWRGLAEPLKQACERWPELEADCQRALASVQQDQPAG